MLERKAEYSLVFSSGGAKGAVPTEKQSESFLKRIEHTLGLFTSERERGDYCPYEYAKILGQNKTAKALFPELAPAEIFLSLL